MDQNEKIRTCIIALIIGMFVLSIIMFTRHFSDSEKVFEYKWNEWKRFCAKTEGKLETTHCHLCNYFNCSEYPCGYWCVYNDSHKIKWYFE